MTYSRFAIFLENYSEVRKRIILSLIFYLISFALVWCLYDRILHILCLPLKNKQALKLLAAEVTEAFTAQFTLTSRIAFIISSPFIMCQIYFFCLPGLYIKEKLRLLWSFLAFTILSMLGFSLAYFWIIPWSWNFFLSFTLQNTFDIELQVMPRLSSFFQFYIDIITAFIFAFQLPLVLVLLCVFKVVNVKQLKTFRRYFIVAAFVFAAIVTPPDVISQIAVAVPLVLMYEMVLFLIAIWGMDID